MEERKAVSKTSETPVELSAQPSKVSSYLFKGKNNTSEQKPSHLLMIGLPKIATACVTKKGKTCWKRKKKLLPDPSVTSRFHFAPVPRCHGQKSQRHQI